MPKAKPITEKQFLGQILNLALHTGWYRAHFTQAMVRGVWVTPQIGNPGFPDLVLVRKGVIIVAELKTDVGRPTPHQKLWLAALGPIGRLWRPANWPAIQKELA